MLMHPTSLGVWSHGILFGVLQMPLVKTIFPSKLANCWIHCQMPPAALG